MYTVIIFLARNERIRAVKLRPKNFGRNFLKSAKCSAEQWTKFAQIGRNLPKIFEDEPQLRGFARFAQKYLLCSARVRKMGRGHRYFWNAFLPTGLLHGIESRVH
jgi:hypothetical protein